MILFDDVKWKCKHWLSQNETIVCIVLLSMIGHSRLGTSYLFYQKLFMELNLNLTLITANWSPNPLCYCCFCINGSLIIDQQMWREHVGWKLHLWKSPFKRVLKMQWMAKSNHTKRLVNVKAICPMQEVSIFTSLWEDKKIRRSIVSVVQCITCITVQYGDKN